MKRSRLTSQALVSLLASDDIDGVLFIFRFSSYLCPVSASLPPVCWLEGAGWWERRGWKPPCLDQRTVCLDHSTSPLAKPTLVSNKVRRAVVYMGAVMMGAVHSYTGFNDASCP